MKHSEVRIILALCLFATVPASATVRYVNVNSANPTPPFTNWATAAATIQAAVDVAVAGDQILVTNGLYQTGERVERLSDFDVGMTNRVVVRSSIRVESVNGPEATVILGQQVPGAIYRDGVRCVLLYNGVLSGFTLTNGAANGLAGGGGVYCASTSVLVSNCIITGNSAAYGGGGSFGGTLVNCTLKGNSSFSAGLGDGGGGGAFGGILNKCVLAFNSDEGVGGGAAGSAPGNICTLYNCLLIGNRAPLGGGAGSSFNENDCVLYNCTVAGNSADYDGGGLYSGSAYNSIVYYNTAGLAGSENYDDGSCTFGNSCTTPLPHFGGGNITNEPAFVDYAGGNLRLQTNSPCINAGANSLIFSLYVAARFADLDGNRRIAGVTVDMGAYEFQGAGLSDFTGWLWQFGLRTDGSADYVDSDTDGMNNRQEWIAGTVPTNASSALRLLPPSIGASGILLTWQSVTNRMYFLECSTNLGTQSAFSPVASNIVGQAGTTTYTDSTKVGSNSFYRVRVERVE